MNILTYYECYIKFTFIIDRHGCAASVHYPFYSHNCVSRQKQSDITMVFLPLNCPKTLTADVCLLA